MMPKMTCVYLTFDLCYTYKPVMRGSEKRGPPRSRCGFAEECAPQRLAAHSKQVHRTDPCPLRFFSLSSVNLCIPLPSAGPGNVRRCYCRGDFTFNYSYKRGTCTSVMLEHEERKGMPKSRSSYKYRGPG